MKNKRKPKFHTGQVVMLLKSDRIGQPQPAMFRCYKFPDVVIVDHAGLGMELPLGVIRPLTAREIGPRSPSASKEE